MFDLGWQEEKVRNQSDYDEIKRELMVLKSIEFNSGSSGEAALSTASKEDKEGAAKSLEVLLLEKNRALQTENTNLKVTNSERNGKSLYKGHLPSSAGRGVVSTPMICLNFLFSQNQE